MDTDFVCSYLCHRPISLYSAHNCRPELTSTEGRKSGFPEIRENNGSEPDA